MQWEFYRMKSARGCRPHLSISVDGYNFHIDTLPASNGLNLITHAHTDHYGHRNIDNSRAVASCETAAVLEAVTGNKFAGVVFKVGSRMRVGDVRLKTYPTFHMHGSTAFYLSNLDILITGDVKDYRKLPKCRILVTEATYGHPSNVFEEEIEKLLKVACDANVILGVYPIGKAQRVAEILKKEGIGFSTEEKILKICSALGIEASEGPFLTSPKNLDVYGKGYVLTAQKFYRWPRITISDHLDYRGILEMVQHCEPEEVIFYHGNPSRKLLEHLEREKIVCRTLKDIELRRDVFGRSDSP